MTRHPTRLLAGLFVVSVIVAIAWCGRTRPSRSASIRQLKKSEMSAAELKYGIAPIPDSSVTYQPDVIVVGGGADAIRSQNPNGFIWTIDGNASHASELTAGKVLFMTNRAVGRVLDVHKEGPDLVVVLGPVDITEVIREAHITVDIPIDFAEAIPYTASDLPGRISSAAPISTVDGVAVAPVAYVTGATVANGPPTPPAGPDVSKLVNFKMSPYANESGVGLRATSDGGGLKVAAEAGVRLATPTFKATLDIVAPANLREASLTLGGAAGLKWQFEVGTDIGRSANVDGLLQPDTDFSIPIGGLGPVPLAVTVRQRFLIKTALGVRNSTLGATGDYTFDGSFKVGYFAKKWDVAGPVGFSARQSMLQSATGISLGASGVDLAHEMKVIVGIGAFGFATGPYFRFTSGVGLFKGSSLGMIECKEATLAVKLSGGVGYMIPKAVTSAINSILSALNIKYRVNGEGGLSSGEPMTIVNSTSTMQGCKAGEGRE